MEDVAAALVRERSRVSLFRGERSIFYPRSSSSSARIPPSVQILDFFLFFGLINAFKTLQSPPVTPVWNLGISDECFPHFLSAVKLTIRQKVI